MTVTRLLVANRGEIARRVFRTARAMGIETVAVFSDADASAPHVRETDQAVRLPGSSPAETYLDIERIVGAARSTGADAIHPGYGFLSENAAFARACADAGITFVGPPPAAIDAMGSKIAAKALMADAGVPILPGATVHSGDDLATAASSVGYPLLVKAAFGGGGRGMRVVHEESGLDESVAGAEREAAAAFGDGTVFLERFVVDPRHVEVQIFGDSHGNVIHLFERECSIQRRYQKIIEEAPSPAVDEALRASLGAAAVTAAQALGYVGAGTVEFVLAPDGAFFFLEVNTRLQVEHPVTELVTGLDLVELQLRVARGERLPPEACEATLTGHAVEARLYAEDVVAGFVPASGRIHRFRVPDGPGVRVDAGYDDGSTVSTHYDAMLAKVIAYGDTRAEATARLATALAGSRIHGVVTNRDLLVRILRHPEFAAGQTDTGFLDRHDPVELGAGHGDADDRRRRAVAAALAAQAARRAAAPVQPTLPSGWRNVATGLQRASFDDDSGERVEVGYGFGRDGLVLEVDGEPLLDVRLWSAAPDLVDVTVDGIRRRFDVHQHGDVVYVDDAAGSTTFHTVERFPLPQSAVAAGSLLAPLPGGVTRVLAAVGQAVEAGEVLVVLEAMKMEHSIRSPHAGTVTTVAVAVGDQVDTGAVLAVVEEPDDE